MTNIRIFVELNTYIDDYQGDALGIFTRSGWCIFGILWLPGMKGVIMFNKGIGLWRDPEAGE